MFDNDFVTDYGFEEPDQEFFFFTKQEEKIEILKNRRWFDMGDDDLDYAISYSIIVDGKEYMKFPEDVERHQVESVALVLFEKDEEATREIEDSIYEMEAERRFGA